MRDSRRDFPQSRVIAREVRRDAPHVARLTAPIQVDDVELPWWRELGLALSPDDFEGVGCPRHQWKLLLQRIMEITDQVVQATRASLVIGPA